MMWEKREKGEKGGMRCRKSKKPGKALGSEFIDLGPLPQLRAKWAGSETSPWSNAGTENSGRMEGIDLFPSSHRRPGDLLGPGQGGQAMRGEWPKTSQRPTGGQSATCIRAGSIRQSENTRPRQDKLLIGWLRGENSGSESPRLSRAASDGLRDSVGTEGGDASPFKEPRMRPCTEAAIGTGLPSGSHWARPGDGARGRQPSEPRHGQV
ncbi:hypothetical protein BJX63DRAFT_360991 [Aspergillus granulosus]|uniref:Uncharacterized protein n=1 Tax=Aspergillus granulosus TaxID=176169 RepID=A0ABR4HW83_9EURO